MKTSSISYALLTLFLRGALVVALVASGWLIYSKLPPQDSARSEATNAQTTLQILLRPPAGNSSDALDIPVELYPVDIVAARHEYFTERRAGKRFDEFLGERMKDRAPVSTQLDKQGQAFVAVSPGSWWLHAQFSGEENLEWRLRLDVAGAKQSVELTTQNIYTRTRSF
ncbi:MAG: hypothetical protein ABJC10_11175 [Acidobacteriota bacterium]